jgi:hypothetical protein
VTAPGATCLDYRLVERERMPLAIGGFGQEVRDALTARAEHLAAQGLAGHEGTFQNAWTRQELMRGFAVVLTD